MLVFFGCAAAAVEGVDVFGVQRDRAVVVLDGEIVFAFISARVAASDERIRVIGIELERVVALNIAGSLVNRSII